MISIERLHLFITLHDDQQMGVLVLAQRKALELSNYGMVSSNREIRK